MANTYISLYVHCVFSTKNREPLLAVEWRPRLWAYFGGIAAENGFRILEAGGMADHVHLLASLPAPLAMSKALQLLKGGSSKWINDSFFAGSRSFAWQEGYGGFGVGVSQIDATRAYIRNQEEHHRATSFQEEYRAFLTRHGIEIDERYVWG